MFKIPEPMFWTIRGGQLDISKPLMMGILNLTPDSFSDGGRLMSEEPAFRAAEKMVLDGADILDLGGESTRPGAQRISAREELDRVLPVLKRICTSLRIPVSVDTTKPEVARVCVEEGANIINDVSGLADSGEAMAKVVYDSGAGLVLMHRRGNPETMQQLAHYENVTREVLEDLRKSIDLARRCGVKDSQWVVDPGFGFAKDAEQNFLLLKQLDQFAELGRPVLVGPSRKSFIGKVTGREPEDRDYGTAAAVTLAYARGARIFRVHQIAAMRDVLKVCEAVVSEGKIFQE